MCQGWLIGNKGSGPQTRQQEVNVIGTPNGNLGGIAVVPEASYGVTPGAAVWEWQHPVSSTIGLRRPVIQPNLLSFAAHSARGYSGSYCDGDLVVGLDFTDAVIGSILSLAGVFDIDHYTMADGRAPDLNSISALVSYGGGGSDPTQNHEWVFAGVKPNEIRFDLVAESNSTVTLVGIGPEVLKTALGSAEAPAPPPESDVVMPLDIGGTLIGLSAMCLHSATLGVLVPKTGYERRCLGGNMKEPITAGRPDVTWTLNLDLDDASDNNTINVLADFVAGDYLGDIKIGPDFTLTDCLMGGDFPALQEGQIDFSISGTASSLRVDTT